MLKIHTLHVENFAGIREATLELQDNGVTVIYGPNEAGKSTLLRAFNLLISDTKVTSGAKNVKESFPKDRDENPRVSAELTVGSYRLHIEKFYKPSSGKAMLKILEPHQESLSGRDAEDRFKEIIDAETDRSLLTALTIEQGKSLDKFSALNVASLASVMQNHDQVSEEEFDGDAVASANSYATGLLDAIEKEYARYWTSTGQIKTKSEFRAKKDAVDEAKQTLAEAETTYREAQGYIDKLDQLQTEKTKVAEQLPEAQEAVGVREKESKTAETVAAKLAQLEDKVASAQQRHALAANQWKTRQNLVEQLQLDTQDLEEHAAALKASQKAYEAEAKLSEDRDKRIAELEQQRDAAHDVRHIVEAAHVRLQAAEAVVADHAVLEGLSELDKRKSGLEQELAENPATPALIAELRRAMAQLDAATQLRDAVATAVHVDGPSGEVVSDDTGGSYELGDDGVDLSIASRRAISLGEFTVTVTPTQDQADQDRAVQRAQREVDAVAEKLGLENCDGGTLADTAEECADERQRLVDALSELDVEISAKAAGRSVEGIRDELKNKNEEFAQAHVEVERALESLDAENLGEGDVRGFFDRVLAQNQTLNSAEGLVTELQALLELDTPTDFAAVVRQSRAASEVADKKLRAESSRGRGTTDATKSFFEARAAHASVEKALAKTTNALAHAREEQPDELLSGAVDEAVAASEAAETELREAREANAGVSLEGARDSLDNARARVGNLEDRLRAIDMDQASNEAYLDGRSDAADRRESAKAELERAERDYDRIEAQANAARLLFTTVTNARAEMQAQYEKPFKETFEKLAEVVYGPGVSFELAEDFSVAKRVMGGMDLEPQQLSGGAQEQMLILARIAVATLVGGGEAVPIFIDDALGFSDVHRIESMNNVLGRLGRDNQVIVLTCDVDRFDGIPGARQLSIDGIKSAG